MCGEPWYNLAQRMFPVNSVLSFTKRKLMEMYYYYCPLPPRTVWPLAPCGGHSEKKPRIQTWIHCNDTRVSAWTCQHYKILQCNVVHFSLTIKIFIPDHSQPVLWLSFVHLCSLLYNHLIDNVTTQFTIGVMYSEEMLFFHRRSLRQNW